MIIYKHTSKTTGKSYIGLSRYGIDRRFQSNKLCNRGLAKRWHFDNCKDKK